MPSYKKNEVVWFWKTKEKWGGLSNMAAGYPLDVNGVRFLTSEALYQAMRFPHLPDVQKAIIETRSPMSAKMIAKKHAADSIQPWEEMRVQVMAWCLDIKAKQNAAFRELLEQTGDLPIVEYSRKDPFWGAVPVGDEDLVGDNTLGNLLINLRAALRTDFPGSFDPVYPPLNMHYLKLFGEQLREVI